jgi:hypothetical protein
MTIKTYFAIFAVLSILFGIGFVLGPGQVLSNYGIENSPHASVGASGPHDFAVRKASALVSNATSHPSHPAAHVRDDRETPLCWDGIARNLSLIWG